MFPWAIGSSWGFGFAWIWPFVILDLVLKGFALWRSAKNNQPVWFVILLIVSSLGILPLIYLIVVDKNYVFKDLQKRFG